MSVAVAGQISVSAVPGLPVVKAGDDLAQLIITALLDAEIALRPHDVVVVASKVVARAEDRFVDLDDLDVGAHARELAGITGKDARLVQLVLDESTAVSRAAPGVLVVRHRLGFVSANAGIDASNVGPEPERPGRGGGADIVLRLPADPDASARRIADALSEIADGDVGVVISDSHGRPFRRGQLGTAIGVARLPACVDRRGDTDLFGRVLENTELPIADSVAVAADLVAGPADEARPVILVRGLQFESSTAGADALMRPPKTDLYA